MEAFTHRHIVAVARRTGIPPAKLDAASDVLAEIHRAGRAYDAAMQARAKAAKEADRHREDLRALWLLHGQQTRERSTPRPHPKRTKHPPDSLRRMGLNVPLGPDYWLDMGRVERELAGRARRYSKGDWSDRCKPAAALLGDLWLWRGHLLRTAKERKGVALGR